MKTILMAGVILLLAGCGGVHKARQARGPVAELGPVPVSFGPISKACMRSGREARTRRLCGCVQAVADKTLTNRQQSRAVKFYANPHLAQEIRQSDRPSNERFWRVYTAYGQQAERICG